MNIIFQTLIVLHNGAITVTIYIYKYVICMSEQYYHTFVVCYFKHFKNCITILLVNVYYCSVIICVMYTYPQTIVYNYYLEIFSPIVIMIKWCVILIKNMDK